MNTREKTAWTPPECGPHKSFERGRMPAPVHMYTTVSSASGTYGHAAVSPPPNPVSVYDDPNGVMLKTTACATPLVLISRASRLSVKPVSATVTKRTAEVAKNTTWFFDLNGSSWKLFFHDIFGLPLVLTKGDRENELRNWQSATSGPDQRNDWGFASGVKVLWAGDLNGDNGLDILLKQGDAEISATVELYLSSGSHPADVHLADIFDLGGC